MAELEGGGAPLSEDVPAFLLALYPTNDPKPEQWQEAAAKLFEWIDSAITADQATARAHALVSFLNDLGGAQNAPSYFGDVLYRYAPSAMRDKLESFGMPSEGAAKILQDIEGGKIDDGSVDGGVTGGKDEPASTTGGVGGLGGTTGGVGIGGADPAADLSDEDLLQYIRENYGYLSWVLEIPELRDVLMEAARDGWGELEIEAGFRDTQWWKTHSVSEREYIRRLSEDPAQLEAETVDREIEIRITAQQRGIEMDPTRIRELAENSIRFGFSPEELSLAVAAEFSYNPETDLIGDIGATAFDAKEFASQYLVPLDDQVAADWANKITSGEATQSGFEQYVRNIAIGRFPSLKGYMEQGITPEQFFSPYAQTASQLLERPFTVQDIVADGGLNKMMDFTDEKGNVRPMTLSEFQTLVRQQPDWRKTGNAKASASQLALGLLKTFGEI